VTRRRAPRDTLNAIGSFVQSSGLDDFVAGYSSKILICSSLQVRPAPRSIRASSRRSISRRECRAVVIQGELQGSASALGGSPFLIEGVETGESSKVLLRLAGCN